MKNICILGVTGSIGTQTIDVVKNNKDKFNVISVSAGKNIQLLKEILSEINVQHVCVIEENDANTLKKEYPDIHFYHGEQGLIDIATLDDVDIVLNGIVGFAGLLPTMNAIKCHKDIALANKETLVVAGHLIIPLVKEYNVKLLPVDSEHSAIFQSLNGSNHDDVNKIILTCSGGSFRTKSLEELKGVTVKEALNHPKWSMGAKITIDSATLFNKGLEVMEAKWLFDVDYDDIEVVIHPEAIIHSAVEYKDTAVIAQLGTPDMRLPIQYALTYPRRDILVNSKRLSLPEIAKCTFYKPDLKRFKALELSYKAGKTGGSMPCVLNGANEMANLLFRQERIEFLDIIDLVESAMNAHTVIDNPSLDELIEIDDWARKYVLKIVEDLNANNH